MMCIVTGETPGASHLTRALGDRYGDREPLRQS
jgi:hypothetical protein